jgi:GNAT superfamily N-acetyltransferase
MFESAALPPDPGKPPPALELCRRILDTTDRPLRCKSGPTFVFPANVRFSSDNHIERSDRACNGDLRRANPGNWQAVEWDELLDGTLGPWTMVIEKGVAVSICHTPVPVTARAAECGVWTHPSFRGRGYGAAVTSEWAAITRPSGRHLFYSTDAGNLSSQRLAGRLGLRLIGWTWRLDVDAVHETNDLHPLSSLRKAGKRD